MTIAEALLPSGWRVSRGRRMAIDAVLILGASLVVAGSAYVRIDLPFTPVPITGQTFAVLLTGAVLGSRKAALAMTTYLLEGISGLPVFAGGTCCIPVLLGPTGGFLLSFPLAAGLTGLLAERKWDRNPRTAAFAMFAGNAVIYLVGLPWLAVFVGGQVFVAGLLPFIPGDVFKLILAALALPAGWQIVNRIKGQDQS